MYNEFNIHDKPKRLICSFCLAQLTMKQYAKHLAKYHEGGAVRPIVFPKKTLEQLKQEGLIVE